MLIAELLLHFLLLLAHIHARRVDLLAGLLGAVSLGHLLCDLLCMHAVNLYLESVTCDTNDPVQDIHIAHPWLVPDALRIGLVPLVQLCFKPI